MKRRLEMEKEIERHERERIQTARPEDLLEDYVPYPISTEGKEVRIQPHA